MDYAQSLPQRIRVRADLFVAVLDGAPPADSPPDDVTLKCFDWHGVIDETDLLLAAHERLRSRDAGTVMRSLLATTVAHVASWDPEVAERLLDEGCDAILNPVPLLQSVAKGKGWTPETDACWELGTASGNGVPHAARASLEHPPRDLRPRLWSAQASVLLPSIAGWLWDLLLEHRTLLSEHLKREGCPADPLDLDIGEITGMVERPGFAPDVRRDVRQMNRWRTNSRTGDPCPRTPLDFWPFPPKAPEACADFPASRLMLDFVVTTGFAILLVLLSSTASSRGEGAPDQARRVAQFRRFRKAKARRGACRSRPT